LNVAPLPTGRAKVGRGVLLEKFYTTRFLLAASRARDLVTTWRRRGCRIRTTNDRSLAHSQWTEREGRGSEPARHWAGACRETIAKRGAGGMNSRTATWLAWYMCAVSLTLMTLGLFLLVLSRSPVYADAPVFDYWLVNTVIAISFSTVGGVIAPRLPPQNPIGWIFCTIGLVAGMRLFVAEYAVVTLLAEPGTVAGTLRGGEALAWVSSWLWVVHIGLFVFLALLFPDGRPPTARWRPFGWLVAGVMVVGTVSVALWPETAAGFDLVNHPLGIEVATDTLNPVETLLYGLALVAMSSMLVRLRRSKGVERQQIKWFAYAVAVLATSAILAYVVSESMGVVWLGWVSTVLVIISVVGLPVAVGIAILRYRLYEIDLLINRTLVYGSLTVSLALVYVGAWLRRRRSSAP
jgi:hypothetical protein